MRDSYPGEILQESGVDPRARRFYRKVARMLFSSLKGVYTFVKSFVTYSSFQKWIKFP
jgi:hypothetical protein